MQRNHAHEDKPHEGMHRGTVSLADELTFQERASPFREIIDVFHVIQVDLGSACISANKGALAHRMMFEFHSPGW